MNSSLNTISDFMIERYSKRFKELGYDIKTLGWGSVEQQHHRFKHAIDQIHNIKDKTILDIGCGFGDFLTVLIAENKPFKRYTGWDINPDLIREAKSIWEDKPVQAQFVEVNISEGTSEYPKFDIGFMFGVLNLNLKEQFDNYEYSKIFIRNAFSSVNDILVVDFLSTHLIPDYPKEDFVFYHDPVKMLEFALTLTPNVLLKHNYAPIPQKEFMLFLYK